MIRSRRLSFSNSSHSRSIKGRRKPSFEQLEIRNLLAVLVVDNVNDSGLGSLRHAIELANGQAGADSIEFAIPGAGPHSIKPQSPLPPILESLTIDGYSQSGSFQNTLVNGQNNAVIAIEIDGSEAGADSVGLGIYGLSASNSVIRGLSINNFDPSSIHFGQAIDIQGAENVTVEGNFLGIDVAGATAKPNSHGVYLRDVATGRIGTDGDGNGDAAERNLVSGNRSAGISLVTTIYNNNLSRIIVAGNSIGVDRLGQNAIGNGIGIHNAFSQANTLLGTDGGSQHLSQRNLVSGNLQNGIDSTGSINVTIAGNFVGTDFSGTAPLGNLQTGIVLPFGSSGNIVGTNGDGVGDQYEGNLVSGNADQIVVQVDGANNVIAGNLIGLDVSGTFAISAPAGNAGVFLQGAGGGNLVGTNSDGVSDELERNVIASAGFVAVRIDSGVGGNRISGNYLNTDASGLQAIPVSSGVLIIDSPNNIIGTDGDGIRDAAESNVIGGGIGIAFAASMHNIVAGNLLAVGADGVTPLGGGISVVEGASANRIGTNGDGVSDLFERNVVNYIHLTNNSETTTTGSNQVSGNYVGVAADGTTLIGRSDVVVFRSDNNLIGTNADGQNDAIEANVIGGSQESWGAIQLIQSSGNTIAGNFVGVGADGMTPIPNAYGVGVIGPGVNLLGGTHPSAGNRIANSINQGILVLDGRLTILGNRVYSNGPSDSLLPTGIDLGWDQSVQANDPLDSDVGANDLQNFPDISNVLITGIQATISGEFHGVPNQTYRVELFGNSQLDASGYGEGERFLGFVEVNTDVSGNGSFSVALPGLTVGDWVTSTATDVNGNTSEFSLGKEAVLGTQPPIVSVEGPTTGVRGQPRTFVLSATDDLGDQAVGFTYSVDWGDGTPLKSVPASPGNGAGVALRHRFKAAGNYSVTVTATDQAGQTSNVATTPIAIVPVAVQSDPLYPGTTMLVVGGTTSDDEIEIEWDNDDSHFEVEINDHDLGNYAASGRIVVYALAGDDKVELAGNITQSAWLYGGRGDDHLKGGKGDDVLLGGKGDDLLVGGSGRDLMIAGYGEDRVVGNSDDDILISGVTDFDSNDNALQAILLEWTSDNCYATRVDHLTGQSGGLNGTIYLTFDGPTATVHDDNAKDTLTGSAGNDWFFANLFLDNGDDATKKDKITDLHASEFASDLDFILS